MLCILNRFPLGLFKFDDVFCLVQTGTNAQFCKGLPLLTVIWTDCPTAASRRLQTTVWPPS